MRKIGVPQATKASGKLKTKPIEIIDDVVDIGEVGKGWDRVERNGRMYLTKRA